MIQSKSSDQEIQDLISKKEFVKAKNLLEKRLANDPSDPQALFLYGVFFYFQGQVNQAVEYLKRTLSQDSSHVEAAICLSILYNDIGKYEESKRVFDRANVAVTLKQNHRDPQANRKFALKHSELGDLYYRCQRYDEAIEEYGKAQRLDPMSQETRIKRAKAYAKKGYLTRAAQELQQLKQEAPASIPARIQLGMLYFSQGNILDAELEWEQVIELDSENPEALSYLKMAKISRSGQKSPALSLQAFYS